MLSSYDENVRKISYIHVWITNLRKMQELIAQRRNYLIKQKGENWINHYDKTEENTTKRANVK